MKVADLFAKLSLRPDAKSFETGDRLIEGIKTAVAGLAVLAGVNWAAGLIKDTSLAASQFKNIEQRVGVASTTMQELAYAAETTGVEVDNLTEFLQDLQEKAVESADSDDLKKAFKTLGVEVKDSSGKLKNAETLMNEVADAYAKMEDGGKKTAITMQLFSDEGTKMIPLLNKGSGGIAELRTEFRDLGGVITDETTKSFAEFNADQARIKAALVGIRNEGVRELLPHLKQLARGMITWIKANRQLIRQRMQTALEVIVASARLLVDAIGAVLDVFTVLRENMALTLTALSALTVAMLLYRAASIKAAIAAAAGWLVGLAPFILLAAGIAAVILIVEDLYHAFTGGESVFKDLYLAAKEWIDEKVGGIIRDAKKEIEDFLGIDVFGPEQQAAPNLLADEPVRERQARVVPREGGKPGAVRRVLIQADPEAVRPRRAMFPSTSETGDTTIAPEFNADIAVTVQGSATAADAERVGREIRSAISDFWDSKMRDLIPIGA